MKPHRTPEWIRNTKPDLRRERIATAIVASILGLISFAIMFAIQP